MYSNGTQYRKPITVGTASAVVTDYQVKATVSFVSGKMNADFSDLLFETSDGTNLPYWIESKTNSVSAVVWIKIPTTSTSSSQTIYMYYGNSGATSQSSGTNTFEFFDDFANLSAWTITAGSPSVSSSVLTVSNGQALKTTSRPYGTKPFLIEGRYQRPSQYRNRMYNTANSGNPAGFDYGDFDSIYWNGFTGTTLSYNTWYIVRWYDLTNNYGWQFLNEDYTNKAGAYWKGSTIANTGYLELSSTESASSVQKWDWVRWRKYAATEPSTTFGNEEMAVSPSDSITISESIALELPPPGFNISTSEDISISESSNVVSELNVQTAPTKNNSGFGTTGFGLSQFGISTTNQVLDQIIVLDNVNLEMGDLTVVASDTVNITENVQNIISDANINISDTVILSESTKLLQESFIDVSDNIIISEQENIALASQIGVSDDIAISEAVTLLLSSFLSVAENITIIDLPIILILSFIAVSDNITISEQIKTTLESFVNANDSITVSEDTTVSMTRELSVNDSITVDELVKPEITSFIDVSDSISVQDSVSVLVPELLVVASENITLGESIKDELDIFVQALENISVNENNNLLEESNLSIVDQISVSEDITVLAADIIDFIVSDSLAVTDESLVSLLILVNATETIDVSENITLEQESFIDKSENISVSEQIYIDNTRKLSVSDSVDVSENFTGIVPIELSVSESITLSENVSNYVTTEISVSDQITLSDSESVQPVVIDLIVSDSVSVSDVPNILRIEPDNNLSVADSVSVTDTPVQFDIRYVDEIARKLVMVDGRLAYLITGRYSSMPQYVFI